MQIKPYMYIKILDAYRSDNNNTTATEATQGQQQDNDQAQVQNSALHQADEKDDKDKQDQDATQNNDPLTSDEINNN
jgi:hypothetical protein